MMRLSRWGRSPYETEADIRLESDALSEWVQVQAEGADADIVVIHSKISFGAAEHKRSPSLKLLITTTSGTDHIDIEYFKANQISVARLPEARRDAVVDVTIAMLIWGLRKMGPMQEAARQGRWIRGQLSDLRPVGMMGSRIGVVGLGVIGRRVCEALKPLGVELWGADPLGIPDGVRPASIAEMVGHCEALTLHCGLETSSRNLLSSQVLDGAHPDLVIVNTARGGVLDLPHAIEMARLGRLGAVAVDVFPEEPWSDMDTASELSNVMYLPHAAGYHRGLARSVREGLCTAVEAFVQGKRVGHLV